MNKRFIVKPEDCNLGDSHRLGFDNALFCLLSQQKNLSLNIPETFCIVSEAFRSWVDSPGLKPELNNSIEAFKRGEKDLLETEGAISLLLDGQPFSPALTEELSIAFKQLSGSGALPLTLHASYIYEEANIVPTVDHQQFFIQVRDLEGFLKGVRHLYAGLFNQRALSLYSQTHVKPEKVSISVRVQSSCFNDIDISGQVISADVDTGFDQVVFISSTFGLYHAVLQGKVHPDEFYISKKLLNKQIPAVISRSHGNKMRRFDCLDADVSASELYETNNDLATRYGFSIDDEVLLTLANDVLKLEKLVGKPLSISWAKNRAGEYYVVHACIQSLDNKKDSQLERYLLNEHSHVLCEGRSAGHKIAAGKVRLVKCREDLASVNEGDVLVAPMTDPDWEPYLRRAAAIVTDKGGRTCHAAIIARELGIPAVVGCIDATEALAGIDEVTVCCAEGDTGLVYKGSLQYKIDSDSANSISIATTKHLPVEIMMNVGNPDRAFKFQSLPNDGVGLARLEFIINRLIGIHPKALLNIEQLPSQQQESIKKRIAGYASPEDFYRQKMVEGISTIASTFYGKKVIVRLSDFKSSEYAFLIGGESYEPEEENPMMGFRGVSRYISQTFQDCFRLECEAIKTVRETMGLENVEVMVPFCRTPGEARQVLDLLKKHGLERGKNGLRLILMCEVPANALLAEEFLEFFDGFSIGSNDLTQLTLGIDRNSELVAHIFDERSDAVKALVLLAIKACKKQGKYIGICGQAPSDYPEFASWLVASGIDAISLDPDSVIDTWMYLAKTSEIG